jgi:4-hydroxysphinganine ceramide fatty acyl 2-hydroxylase
MLGAALNKHVKVFTRTKWFVVPLFWGPITAYLGLRSVLQFAHGPLPAFSVEPRLPLGVLPAVTSAALAKFTLSFLLGNVIWTLLEYGLHRFLFHIDEVLPDKPFFLMLHFLLHGIHHYLPMDRLRLVMPPVLFASLSYPFTQLAHKLFPAAMANGIIAGAFTFCKSAFFRDGNVSADHSHRHPV